jgi:hypothetical protein
MPAYLGDGEWTEIPPDDDGPRELIVTFQVREGISPVMHFLHTTLMTVNSDEFMGRPPETLFLEQWSFDAGRLDIYEITLVFHESNEWPLRYARAPFTPLWQLIQNADGESRQELTPDALRELLGPSPGDDGGVRFTAEGGFILRPSAN